MLTVFVHTLKESFHRRIALALIVVAFFLLILQVGFTHFERDSKGSLVVRRFQAATTIDAKTFVISEARPEQVSILAGFWVLLSLVAAAPLLTSYMEKGWVELLLSKGTARWKIFAGRYFGAIGLFAGTAILMNVIAVTYFSLRAGVPLQPYFVSLGLIFVSFLSSVALLALVSTVQPNTALLMIVMFIELVVAETLSGRKHLYGVITARWAQWCLDWLYRILPKHPDLVRMARTYAAAGHVDSWFPLWTSALFFVVLSAWSLWRFQRKAF